jgi:hypothetical protein
MTIYEISGNLGEWLEGSVDKCYDRVYVSIGGKINQKEQYFNYPEEAKNKVYPSNAGFQMVPAFLRNSDAATLVIVVDQGFGDVYQTVFARPNLDVLLVNADVSLGIKHLIQDVMYYVVGKRIPPHRFMICNFIRFSHPNVLEQALEESVPKKIQRYVGRYAGYEDCFYQWYGYSIYTYNLVYQYRRYDLMRCLHGSQLIRLFERVFRTLSINSSNAQLLQIGVDGEREQKMVSGFLQSSVDFTESVSSHGSSVKPLFYNYIY